MTAQMWRQGRIKNTRMLVAMLPAGFGILRKGWIMSLAFVAMSQKGRTMGEGLGLYLGALCLDGGPGREFWVFAQTLRECWIHNRVFVATLHAVWTMSSIFVWILREGWIRHRVFVQAWLEI